MGGRIQKGEGRDGELKAVIEQREEIERRPRAKKKKSKEAIEPIAKGNGLCMVLEPLLSPLFVADDSFMGL